MAEGERVLERRVTGEIKAGACKLRFSAAHYDPGMLRQARPEAQRVLAQTDLPLTIGLLVDVSPSQEALIETERQAATSFFQTVLKNRDMAFALSFGSEAELLQDLTSSPKILTQSRLSHLRRVGFRSAKAL